MEIAAISFILTLAAILIFAVGAFIGSVLGEQSIKKKFGLDNYTSQINEALLGDAPKELLYTIRVQNVSKKVIKNIEEYSRGWIGAKVECDICTTQWVAVYHESCDKLECPTCNSMVNFEIVEVAP